MKKNIIKAVTLFFVAILFVCNTGNAQIEVVGNDYSANLTGSKSCYDRDVDFERYFPSINTVSPREAYGEFSPEVSKDLNMTGDTLYLYKDISVH